MHPTPIPIHAHTHASFVQAWSVLSNCRKGVHVYGSLSLGHCSQAPCTRAPTPHGATRDIVPKQSLMISNYIINACAAIMVHQSMRGLSGRGWGVGGRDQPRDSTARYTATIHAARSWDMASIAVASGVTSSCT
jgi:hypothetical protein